MRRLMLLRRPIICYTQSTLFPYSFASFSSYNHYLQHHHQQDFLSLLKNYPSSHNITLQVHSQLTTSGLLNQFTNTQIIFVFNTLLRHYALSELPQHAFSLYKQAQSLSLYFDSFTYSFLIKACAKLNYRFAGFQFHALVVNLGFEWHVYVQTALLNMYVDSGLLSEAQKVFDEMPERNLVTWNVMITGLLKWGFLEDGLALFWEMPSRNIISWTGMIDGCTKLKDYAEAYSLFRKMVMVAGIMPTDVTFLAIFPAIADLGDVKNCQLIHANGFKRGFNVSETRVTNNLIDTYAKCGCVRSAFQVFKEMPANRRDLVSWTSIISGFAMHGMAKDATESFRRMESLGFRPNRVTFLSVLNACSHSGLVEEGLLFFRRMTDFQVVPELKHYGCVIDMLGRAGRLKEAEEIACQIPDYIDNVIIWRTLLGACSLHGDAEIAERVTKRLQKIERGYGGDYVLMSNILRGHGKFSDAEKVRLLMDNRNVPKIPAHSSA